MKINTEEKSLIRLEKKYQSVKSLSGIYGLSTSRIYAILQEEDPIDTKILIKLIPGFIEAGIKVELEEDEQERLRKLIGAMSNV